MSNLNMSIGHLIFSNIVYNKNRKRKVDKRWLMNFILMMGRYILFSIIENIIFL